MASYFDKKKKYYDLVISKYSMGMTAKEIVKTIPISDSTVYRWVEEHLKKEKTKTFDELVLPRTPSSVAKTIRAMQTKITELQCRLEISEEKNRVLEDIVVLLRKSNVL